MTEPAKREMSVEEFYLWQLDQDERYELVDGVPRPLRGMTGASNVHDTILVNGIGELVTRLRGKPCRVYSPDTALRTKIRTARRPDITIDCAPPQAKSYESHRPTVVIEILSPSTKKIDHITKLEEYRRHPTIRHILFVDPDAVRAVHFSRPEGGEWTDVDLAGREAVIHFSAVEVSLPLGALYDRLEVSG
jgi:Uma2 family endonuclease